MIQCRPGHRPAYRLRLRPVWSLLPNPPRAPHEHLEDLADSEELGVFRFWAILGRKSRGSFRRQHRRQLAVLEEGSCRVSPPGHAGSGLWLLDIWIRSVACPCRRTGFHT